MLVSKNDVVSIRGANGVKGRKFEWLCVYIGGQCLVAKPVDELARQDLVPDRAGDGVSKCTTNIIGCEEETGDDSEVLRVLVIIYVMWERNTHFHV